MGLQKSDVFLLLLITHFHINAHTCVYRIFSAVLFSVYFVMFFTLTISNPCSTLLNLISLLFIGKKG